MSAEPVREERRGSSRGLILGLVLFGVVLLLTADRLEPPAPLGADAPAAEFSGARSLEILRTLVGDGSPHPTGSPANDRIRAAIVAELRRLGYEPSVQDGVACNSGGYCGRVQNVAARTGPGGNAVLLMAHYDSVPSGPGVGDDLSGVATVLETARALKAGPPPAGPVILLLTDGEELGLLGAELFVNRHPWAAEVGTVVNLEARGTSGPSLMFETIGDDALPVQLYTGAAPRPITSSVYATIYEMLPNDTDLTVFKNRRDRDYRGLNFAFIRSPSRYHTAADVMENLSPGSLQHHGDNALATVRALAGSKARLEGDAVFFDILAFGKVSWPKGWTIALAILALALVVFAVFRRRGGLLFGLLGFLGSLVLAGLLGFGLSVVLRGATPGNWVAGPHAEIAAFWLLGLAATLTMAGLVASRAGSAGLWSGVWIGWAVLGVVVALTAPGISYLFLVPALVAGLVGLFRRGGETSLIPAGVAFLLWIPILLPLYDGLGKQALLGIAVLGAALFTTLAPLVPDSGRLGRRLIPIAAFVLALVAAAAAFASAPYTPESPQPVAIQFHQDADTGEARWLVRSTRPMPAALRQAAQFGQELEQIYPWMPAWFRVPKAPAPRLDVPGPQVSVLEDSAAGGKRRLRLLVTSNRQATIGGLFVPPGAKLESARVDGQEVPLQGPRKLGWPKDAWTELSMMTMRPDGMEVELVLGAAQPLELYVYDRTNGLPLSAEALRKARPAYAVTFQEGDTTTVSRKVRI